jgi:hypothetical protein
MQTASQGSVVLCLVPPLILGPREHCSFSKNPPQPLALLFDMMVFLPVGKTDENTVLSASLFVLGFSMFRLLLCFVEMLHTG